MEEQLKQLIDETLDKIKTASTPDELSGIRVSVLGKKGALTGLLKDMKNVAPEERAAVGKIVNDAKAAISGALENAESELKKNLRSARLREETIDVTLPAKKKDLGHRHPNRVALEEVERIFIGMGYEVVHGPEVEFDYYYGSLSGKNAGFYIYNGETEAAALFISKYSGTEVVNTFGLDRGLIPALGSSAVNNDAICVETNKTHFEIVFDFGEKSMYCSTNANGKSQTSEKKPFAEATLTSFVVKSDYNNSGRRCWFDNLKISKIQAGAVDPSGIENAKAADAKEAPVKVLENGQIIIGGKYNAAGALVK